MATRTKKIEVKTKPSHQAPTQRGSRASKSTLSNKNSLAAKMTIGIDRRKSPGYSHVHMYDIYNLEISLFQKLIFDFEIKKLLTCICNLLDNQRPF